MAAEATVAAPEGLGVGKPASFQTGGNLRAHLRSKCSPARDPLWLLILDFLLVKEALANVFTVFSTKVFGKTKAFHKAPKKYFKLNL